MQVRRSNLEALLETGCVVAEEYDASDSHGKLLRFVTTEEFFGEQTEVDENSIINICEVMAAQNDLVFKFTFDANEEYPWSGGIFTWHEKMKAPENREEADELKGTAVRKFKGRWLADEPEFPVFDKDFPNLMCQLLTALIEIFQVEK